MYMQATRIDKDDLKPALIGLSMVKGKMLLRKAPPSKEINDSDTFSFNDKFRSPHLKIKFAAAGAQKEVLSLSAAYLIAVGAVAVNLLSLRCRRAFSLRPVVALARGLSCLPS
jgi:hypothetical protein